jgi:DNA-binding protein H-NS
MATLKKLLAQKAALDKQIEAIKRRDRGGAIARVKALMAESGLTLADLAAAKGKPTAVKTRQGAKVAVKYRDAATGDTWTGRGLQPRWLRAALAAGRKLEEFKV